MGLFGAKEKTKKKKGDQPGEVILQVQSQPKQGNGDISPEIMEKIIRIVDMRNQQYGPRQSNIGMSDEERKDLRKYVLNTPKDKKRELTIFNEKQVALFPWMRMLEHSFQPMYTYAVDDEGNTVKVATGRKPGSCLTVLMDETEAIARSKNGFLLTHTLGLARQQLEEEAMNKGMSSFGQY